jgi:two-component system, OmpR family, catabolic regulation response regulator CreB
MSVPSKRPKILVIEDEPSISDAIQYALETDGFDTQRLTEGAPALAFLDEHPVDLIVLDIGLPDIGGVELCKEIRKTRAVPIIFLTAKTDEIDRVVGLEIGADDYVVKPFSPRELSARIRAILRRTQKAAALAEPERRVFQIDETRRRITYFGAAVDLSRYEYNLLKVLIARPGHVLSRDRLMDLAWEEPEASTDRTVDAHIKTIRAKLKAIKPELDPITTHRGIGYSLKEDL